MKKKKEFSLNERIRELATILSDNPRVRIKIATKFDELNKEFLERLKELPNSDGGTNCGCVPNEMVEGGRGFTCEFCQGINKLVK